MLDWESIANTVVALLIVAAISGVVTLLVQWVRSSLGKRPDFIVRRVGDGRFTLERTRRRTAFDITVGHGPAWITGGRDRVQGGNHMGVDLRWRGRADLGSLDAAGAWLSWVDGRRCLSDPFDPTEAGVKQWPIYRSKPEHDGSLRV